MDKSDLLNSLIAIKDEAKQKEKDLFNRFIEQLPTKKGDIIEGNHDTKLRVYAINLSVDVYHKTVRVSYWGYLLDSQGNVKEGLDNERCHAVSI
jgi:hypothetical protein